MVASGIPPLAAMLTSLVVFAGASMVASAQLLASGMPALLVILTTLFINLRFMMYSASLRMHFAHAPLRWRLLIAYLVADNAYGLALARFADHPDDPAKLEFFLGTGVPVWLAWQLAVVAGILIGSGMGHRGGWSSPRRSLSSPCRCPSCAIAQRSPRPSSPALRSSRRTTCRCACR